MKIELHAREIEFDEHAPIDISIPLDFNGSQPNAYGVEPASSRACEYGELIGDTRRGGSCNFEEVTLIPHCNGTHTECVGHITNERIALTDCLRDVFIPASLLSVETVPPTGTKETYEVEFGEYDRLITRETLERQMTLHFGTAARTGRSALILRTLPNDEVKLRQAYGSEAEVAPYFTIDAMKDIVDRGFEHLLVDLPSVDRLFDRGKLANHRIFWNIDLGSFETNDRTRRNRTITELIYVPNNVEDGDYLLNLQIAPFASDASPSRPILFRLK